MTAQETEKARADLVRYIGTLFHNMIVDYTDTDAMADIAIELIEDGMIAARAMAIGTQCVECQECCDISADPLPWADTLAMAKGEERR